MKNPTSWFDIPATDFERAKKFYTTILEIELEDYPMPDGKYALFPHNRDAHGASGAILQTADAKPSMDGVTIYLDGGEDLNLPLGRVEAAGGKVIMPKTQIGENGFMALFADTEGNKLAFHSMN
ncbi:VOC family protein [bacterium]|nr:VOC family protein [bacterium]